MQKCEIRLVIYNLFSSKESIYELYKFSDVSKGPFKKNTRMSKSHTEWQQKSRITKKTMFYMFKTSETVVS